MKNLTKIMNETKKETEEMGMTPKEATAFTFAIAATLAEMTGNKEAEKHFDNRIKEITEI